MWHSAECPSPIYYLFVYFYWYGLIDWVDNRCLLRTTKLRIQIGLHKGDGMEFPCHGHHLHTCRKQSSLQCEGVPRRLLRSPSPTCTVGGRVPSHSQSFPIRNADESRLLLILRVLLLAPASALHLLWVGILDLSHELFYFYAPLPRVPAQNAGTSV